MVQLVNELQFESHNERKVGQSKLLVGTVRDICTSIFISPTVRLWRISSVLSLQSLCVSRICKF